MHTKKNITLDAEAHITDYYCGQKCEHRLTQDGQEEGYCSLFSRNLQKYRPTVMFRCTECLAKFGSVSDATIAKIKELVDGAIEEKIFCYTMLEEINEIIQDYEQEKKS